MTLVTNAEAKQLPPGSKIPSTITAIQAIFDQFGMLEKYQRLYGEIFYTPKSSIFPAYVIFSNPQAIAKILNADPDLSLVQKEDSR